MRKLLCYGLLGLALASCASTHNLPPASAPVEPPPSVKLDSAQALRYEATPDSLPFVLVTPKPTLFDQLLHRTPAPVAYRGLPAKIKNSTVSVTYNHVAGNQVNTSTTTTTAKNGRTVVGDGASNTEAAKKAGPITQTAPGASANVVTGKKSGPLTQAAPGADVHVATSKKGPAQAGDGNHATTSSGWPWWLWLVLAALLGYGGFKVYKRFTPI